MQAVSFTRMEDGTAEDYALMVPFEEAHVGGLVDRLTGLLKGLGGNTYGYQVSRLEHSLQSATHAFRDGADDEMVVAALFHDIGDDFAPYNHGNMAAAILRPYVSERTQWIIAKHDIFQGIYFFHHYGRDRHEREKYRGHPYFEACADFCARYDQLAFDPAFDTMPLDAFLPAVNRVFGRKPYAWSGSEGQAA